MYRSFLYPLIVFLLAACSGTGAVEHATRWKEIDGCSFSMRVPAAFKLKRSKPSREQNPSDCNYQGMTNGQKVFDIYSSSAELFDSQDIDTLYKMAIDYSKFTIEHNEQKGNWFVVSGVNPETGNSIYWKRTIGRKFITDLYFDYPKETAAEVEPFIEAMAVSMVSD